MFFIPAMFIGSIDLYGFIPLTDLDLAGGSQGQLKSKTYWFHFLPHLSSDLVDVWGGEAIQAFE